MRQCLDEGMLQSYFDGELSTELMERATSHLASCAACAAAASELEQESSLLSTALAAEFEASVPTERLRQRIDSAVAGIQVAKRAPRIGVVAGLLGSFSNLFNFAPGRTLGYASLMVMLAFGVIFGLMKFRTPAPVRQTDVAVADRGPVTPTPAPGPSVTGTPQKVRNGLTSNYVATMKKPNGSRPVAPKSTAVKLIPGERSYLPSWIRQSNQVTKQ